MNTRIKPIYGIGDLKNVVHISPACDDDSSYIVIESQNWIKRGSNLSRGSIASYKEHFDELFPYLIVINTPHHGCTPTKQI